MTAESQPIRTQAENWDSFQERIVGSSLVDRRRLNRAYQFSKYAHRTQRREGGERYFEHPRAVMLILYDECTVRDPEILIPALLHDAAEDSALFGNSTKMPFSEWREEARETLVLNFGEPIADAVLTVTKPTIDGTEILDKQQSDARYHQQLEGATPKALLVKMADRLHNIRTLRSTSREKQAKQIKETREVYLSLFERALQDYPDEAAYLLAQMQEAMNLIEGTTI